MLSEDFYRILNHYGVDINSSSYGWQAARCPAHDDSRKSFGVNLDTDGWICYAGCGKGRGVASLVAVIEGVDRDSALGRAAAILGKRSDELLPSAPGEPRGALAQRGKAAYERYLKPFRTRFRG